jgi:3-oxoacyl-[acyl-carrier protein] reductase
MNEMKDQVVVITGAGQGIGASIVERFSSLGATVVAIDLNASNLDQVVANLTTPSLCLVSDVTNRSQVAASVSEIVEKFGRIDVLVNNAGITRDSLFHQMTIEEWTQVIDVNLNGGFHITQFCQTEMVKRGYGRIIFISSRSALGNRGQANYAASKAAVQGLTKSLALELGKFGITVNAVAPGFIETEMTHAIIQKTGQTWEELADSMKKRAVVGRLGKPQDIANAVAFFASKESGFITGQVLYVTGAPAL